MRNLHSFTLTPSASHFVRRIKKGQKSGKVSDAIVWYFSSPLFSRERDDDYELTGKLIPSSHGMPVPVEIMDELENLKKEYCELVAKNSSEGGVKHHLVELFKALFRVR